LGDRQPPPFRSCGRQYLPRSTGAWRSASRGPANVAQRGELEFARHTNERTAASYLPPNFESVPFTLIDGETEPLPGIRCLPTPGHVPYHQSIMIESGGERACFLADLVPTSAHLPLPWIMDTTWSRS